MTWLGGVVAPVLHGPLVPAVTVTKRSRVDPKAFWEFMQSKSKDIDANGH